MKTIPFNFTPREYQLPLFQALDGKKIKRAICKWPRRSGKDKSAFCYMIKRAHQEPGNYFYIFPTKEEARRVIWENIDAITGFRLLDHIPAELIISIRNQEMMVQIKAGKCTGKDAEGNPTYEATSIIRVLGYDKNPDSIRGVAAKAAVFSEFAFMDEESYKVLVPSLKQANGWCIIISTPNGRNHFYDLWERVKDNANWFCSEFQTIWPEKDHYIPLLTADDLVAIKDEEGLSDEDIEREFGCQFSTGLKGSYYIDFIDKAREEGRIGTFLHDDTNLVSTLWDIGASDEIAVWFYQSNGNDITFIDYEEATSLSTDQMVRLLKGRGYEYRTHYLPHDAKPLRQQKEELRSVEDDFIDSLRDLEVPGDVVVLPKPGNKQHGIQAVRDRFSLYRFDDVKCMEGIRHLELYSKKFDKKNKVYSNDPIHNQHSHCADALRLEPYTNELIIGHMKLIQDYSNLYDY